MTEKREIPGKIIFKALVGSHAYGTNIEGSDKDYKGVYIQTPEDIYLNGYVEQINVGKDEEYFEIKRFIELCCKANPTVLELLWSPEDCVIIKEPIFEEVIKLRKEFITKACSNSFGGYAQDQINKASGLDKKMNWEKERTIRKSVEDFCWIYITDKTWDEWNENPLAYSSKAIPLRNFLNANNFDSKFCGLVNIEHMKNCYLLFHDDVNWVTSNKRFESINKNVLFKGICSEEGNDVCLSEIPSYMNPKGIVFFNKDAYSIHCKEYKEYQNWLENRNQQRYVDVSDHGQKIDGKNMLHCVRLIETGLEIAKTGKLVVRRPNAKFLVSIRKGKMDLNNILEFSKAKINEMRKAFEESDLPNRTPEEDRHYVSEIRKKYLDLYL